MMKHIKTIAALFIALVAMSSCSKDETPDNSQLAEKLVGEWIMEHDMEGLELFVEDGDTEYPTDGDMFTIIYHFDANGYGWKEFVLMKDGSCVHVFTSRYWWDSAFTYTIDNNGKVVIDYPEEEVGDEMTFDGKNLTVLTDGLYLNFVRATEDQMEKYREEADAFHGGSAEGDTAETNISDKNADEPSRTR
jgi:hypothetical protein